MAYYLNNHQNLNIMDDYEFDETYLAILESNNNNNNNNITIENDISENFNDFTNIDLSYTDNNMSKYLVQNPLQFDISTFEAKSPLNSISNENVSYTSRPMKKNLNDNDQLFWINFPPAYACSPPEESSSIECLMKNNNPDDVCGNKNNDHNGDYDVENENENKDKDNNSEKILLKQNYPLVRGISLAGFMGKSVIENKNETSSSTFDYIKCRLRLVNGDKNSLCRPDWSLEELREQRRIIRIEKKQSGSELLVTFNIVTNNVIEEFQNDDDKTFIEVSCLQCTCSSDFPEDDDKNIVSVSKFEDRNLPKNFYITSVEIIKIVEFLIGSSSERDIKEKRKERSRIRSNLVSFWSRKPISSKMIDNVTTGKTNATFRSELAQRIMSYQTRKPRGFDKEVRILEWAKLIPALKRALQNYYVQIPKTI